MKTTALTKPIVLFASALLLGSCNFNVDLGPGISGDGNVVTETRNSDAPFTSIEIDRGLELELEQSADQSIAVIADQNLQDHISTQISNGVLTITTDENIRNASSQKIVVKMPKVTALQTSSAASIASKGWIKGQDIAISTSSASEVRLAVEAENLTLESSSGSSMKLKGKALKLDVQTSSGSVIDAEQLLANDIICDASSGSTADLRPLVSLKASASSGSHISYRGAPKVVTKDAGSGGSITKE